MRGRRTSTRRSSATRKRRPPSRAAARRLGFLCDDYFASVWAKTGFYDHPARLYLVVPRLEIWINAEAELLVIGRPGVDGIDFGYRCGRSGVWAYIPLDRRFLRIAASTAGLIDAWESNRIVL